MFDVGQLPSLENLRCFLAAAQHLSFRKGAEEVFLTPAAFGQRIKQLEESLGQQFFERTTRSVRMTEAGVRLVPLARATLREARRCRDELDDLDGHNRLPVRLMLGTRFELGASWILPAIIELPEELSHLDIEMYFGSGRDILERLEVGRVDCLVTSAPQARREWAAEFLHREHYVFVAAPSLIAARAMRRIEDAREHTLLDINETMPLARYLTSVVERPLEFERVRCCGAGIAVHEMALAGLGVAVLPEYMIRHDLEQRRLIRLLPDVQLLSDSFRLLYRRDAIFAHTMTQLAEYLRTRPLV